MDTKTLNLDNLKAGDEVVVIKPNGSISGSIRVLEWSESHQGFRMNGKDGKTIGILPKDGKGFYAMHSRETPHFYYSANPIHIKKAKKAIHQAAKLKETKEKLLAEKRELISPLLETYRDSEECYDLEYLPPETLERLTVKQLKTFVSWLK
jgi:hypothetical protein